MPARPSPLTLLLMRCPVAADVTVTIPLNLALAVEVERLAARRGQWKESNRKKAARAAAPPALPSHSAPPLPPPLAAPEAVRGLEEEALDNDCDDASQVPSVADAEPAGGPATTAPTTTAPVAEPVAEAPPPAPLAATSPATPQITDPAGFLSAVQTWWRCSDGTVWETRREAVAWRRVHGGLPVVHQRAGAAVVVPLSPPVQVGRGLLREVRRAVEEAGPPVRRWFPGSRPPREGEAG